MLLTQVIWGSLSCLSAQNQICQKMEFNNLAKGDQRLLPLTSSFTFWKKFVNKLKIINIKISVIRIEKTHLRRWIIEFKKAIRYGFRYSNNTIIYYGCFGKYLSLTKQKDKWYQRVKLLAPCSNGPLWRQSLRHWVTTPLSCSNFAKGCPYHFFKFMT